MEEFIRLRRKFWKYHEVPNLTNEQKQENVLDEKILHEYGKTHSITIDDILEFTGDPDWKKHKEKYRIKKYILNKKRRDRNAKVKAR